MRYVTGVYWDRGNVAEHNQDSVVLQQVLTVRGRVVMAAVCDGMGGLAQGAYASGYVTKRLQEWFYDALLRAVQRRKPYWVIRRSLERLVYHLQEQLQVYGRQEKISLGTTMTVLVIYGRTYLIWHLGDSRVYRISDGKTKRREGQRETCAVCLTKDHAKGQHILTKCVGSFGYERPDFRMGSIRSGQAMLLCSDGFRHCVTEQELGDALRPGELQEEAQIMRRLREVGKVCRKRREQDNMSAIYLKCGA